MQFFGFGGIAGRVVQPKVPIALVTKINKVIIIFKLENIDRIDSVLLYFSHMSAIVKTSFKNILNCIKFARAPIKKTSRKQKLRERERE